ncbi:hypothetical protein Q1695_001109 [Nippostrongylus brasiliensis]|nr:hypothetical protein Q1695_001109 [Nippostrongylus brasiliensis]
MICIWDSLYLLACLATYGVPSLLYGMIPVYGIMAYILFLLQPFASFCVSCTIWQVFAITLERYLAVSKPLEQRALTARFGAGWLCATIVIGAFVLNLLPVPFERQLVPCFEIVGSNLRNHTLLKPFDDSNSRLYRFVVHFFPDLIFRAPLPIIFIGTLTVRTIHACNQRNVASAHLTPQMSRNIPLRLYLLNFKFILCNTLYMFNTILLELLGYGESVESNEEGLIDRYMNSFYLTDASNMLLVLHSATNWLLFYRFPMMSRKRRRFASITLTSSYRSVPVKPRVAELVLRKQTGEQIGQFVEQALKWFRDRGRDESMRQLGQRLGYVYFRSNLQFSAEQWKAVRAQVVAVIIQHSIKDPLMKECCCSIEEIHDYLTRVFNYVLCEMRSGILCAAVEERKRNNRTVGAGVWAGPQEAARRRKLLHNGQHHGNFPMNGLISPTENSSTSR